VEIANALKRENIHVTSDQVRLQGPLKELGLYTVIVHVGQEVNADLKVWVVPTIGEEQPKKGDEGKNDEG
jgi:large subunit ribosomal protein L9